MKFLKYISLGATLVAIILLSGCDKHGDPQPPIDLTDMQKASVSMRGVWGQASDAVLPFGHDRRGFGSVDHGIQD